MSYIYDEKKNLLQLNGLTLPLDDLVQNLVGTCSTCTADVVSLSYHRDGDKKVVAAKCTSCGSLYVILYDDDWNWLAEHLLQDSPFGPVKQDVPTSMENVGPSAELLLLESIPMLKLESVFTQAEIKTLYAKANGKKHVRQYLHRARKKYPVFGELFGIYLNI